MPKFLIPHKSGAHRAAAIALYRALQSQCKRLDVPVHTADALRHSIHYRFAGFRHTTSHRELKVLFEAGYEAVDHLDAAVAGDEKSKQYLLDLLQRAPYYIKRGPTHYLRPTAVATDDEPSVQQPGSPDSDGGSKNGRVMWEEGGLGARPRPRDALGGTGRRQVPKIFSANSIPVLRFTKPQPQALTNYLTSRIRQRQSRHNLRQALEDQLPLAELEDEWDDMLDRELNIPLDRLPDNRPIRWGYDLDRCLLQVKFYLSQEKQKNKAMAERMYAIIDEEEKLAELERAEDEIKRESEADEGIEGLSDMIGDIVGADNLGQEEALPDVDDSSVEDEETPEQRRVRWLEQQLEAANSGEEHDEMDSDGELHVPLTSKDDHYRPFE